MVGIVKSFKNKILLFLGKAYKIKLIINVICCLKKKIIMRF